LCEIFSSLHDNVIIAWKREQRNEIQETFPVDGIPRISYLDISLRIVYITTNMNKQDLMLAYFTYFYFYGKPDPAAVGGA
jgi:hypothetical protein